LIQFIAIIVEGVLSSDWALEVVKYWTIQTSWS